MVKTIREFINEVRTIRKEMHKKGATADNKLIASWLNRLIISLEEIGPTLDLMAEELDQLAEAEGKPTRAKKEKKVKKEKVKKEEKEEGKEAPKPKKMGFWPF